MIQPVRLQLSRRKNFNLQKLSREVNGLPAVKIDRASWFGNPFPILKTKETYMGQTTDVWIIGTWAGPQCGSVAMLGKQDRFRSKRFPHGLPHPGKMVCAPAFPWL